MREMDAANNILDNIFLHLTRQIAAGSLFLYFQTIAMPQSFLLTWINYIKYPYIFYYQHRFEADKDPPLIYPVNTGIIYLIDHCSPNIINGHFNAIRFIIEKQMNQLIKISKKCIFRKFQNNSI